MMTRSKSPTGVCKAGFDPQSFRVTTLGLCLGVVVCCNIPKIPLTLAPWKTPGKMSAIFFAPSNLTACRQREPIPKTSEGFSH